MLRSSLDLAQCLPLTLPPQEQASPRTTSTSRPAKEAGRVRKVEVRTERTSEAESAHLKKDRQTIERPGSLTEFLVF